MKLRIRGNSLRLRLTQGEVKDLATNGIVEDRIDFGNQAILTYRLSRSDRYQKITATFSEHIISVSLPDSLALQWTSTDLVGIEENEGLRILVEKDFQCLKPREEEDESDNFPHPMAVQNC